MLKTKRSKPESILQDLVSWRPGHEPDYYPYFKDYFCRILGYPKDSVRINDTGLRGTPDITLYSQDRIPWAVCEVKPQPGFFKLQTNRDQVWSDQLRRYVTANTIHALLLDPETIVILSPDGRQNSPIDLTQSTAQSLVDPISNNSLAILSYEASLSTKALAAFVSGQFPTAYLDVTIAEGRDAFYEALRLSATELRNYAFSRVKTHFDAYDQYTKKRKHRQNASMGTTPRLLEQEIVLKNESREAVKLREEVLPYFLAQMGREVPTEEAEQREFIQTVYAAEAANLVLARILFVRFFEDYEMTTRKISNGGIAKFRSFYQYVQDDYQYLLKSAFQDTKALYSRLFEESVFDWAHEGDGELSRILLRTFYRLNAFDFRKITGDIMGNLYERFLDPESRKKMGEFYTPQFVVDYILDAIGFKEEPGTILDPACGSGTFLFRSIEFAIEKFRQKGISYQDAVDQAVAIVHGLDINVFAAFIAQLQVIWHLLPHLIQMHIAHLPQFQIYGGIDSLETGKEATLEHHLVTPHEDAAAKIRNSRYKYVVGNPPYIRAERVKTENRWSEYYSTVATGKKDVSFYFLYRAIEGSPNSVAPWLEDGGTMGFIVPFGIADSKAALALRDAILRNHLDELVDLESLSNEVFTSGIATSRSTVAPMIVIASRRKNGSDYNVKVTSATRDRCLISQEVDLAPARSSLIPSRVFTDTAVNPFRQFATKIQTADIDLLRKLFAHPPLRRYAQPIGPKDVALQVGVQTGTGKGKILRTQTSGTYPMAKGLHVHSFVLNAKQITEYVSLRSIQNLSLWRYPSLRGLTAYAVSEIGFAPQACAFAMKDFIAQKSCIVFVPKEEFQGFPWDVYLNSRVPRYLFGLVLRSALIEGEEDLWRAHINSDAVKLFPVPQALMKETKSLRPIAEKLRALGFDIVNRWQTIDDAIRRSDKMAIALVPDLHFRSVGDISIFNFVPVEYSEENGIGRVQPYWRNQPTLDHIEGDPDALQVIKYMMSHPEFGLTPTPGGRIPKDYHFIAKAIREADITRNPEVNEFRGLVEKGESIIASAFSLTGKEIAHIATRLESAPFLVMQPRWPWIPAVVRKTKEYEKDRFA